MKDIRIITTGKGKIEYALEGSGPPVLIVHGGHDSCRGDYGQKTLAENGFSVLTPTRPGYGGTPIESGKTAQETSDLFLELLNALKISEVAVIGNSAGGPVALEFTRRHPRMARKLILESAVVKPWFHRLTVQYYGVKFLFDPKRQNDFWENLRGQLRKNERKTLLKNLKLFTKLKPEDVLSRLS